MSSRVAELIDLIAQGKNAEAMEVLNDDLLSRSYERVNELKPQVAIDYFSPVIDLNVEPEDNDDEGDYVEGDEE
jgi:hypothetical protein